MFNHPPVPASRVATEHYDRILTEDQLTNFGLMVAMDCARGKRLIWAIQDQTGAGTSNKVHQQVRAWLLGRLGTNLLARFDAQDGNAGLPSKW